MIGAEDQIKALKEQAMESQTKCDHEIRSLSKTNKKLQKEVDDQQRQNEQLCDRNKHLQAEVENLKANSKGGMTARNLAKL